MPDGSRPPGSRFQAMTNRPPMWDMFNAWYQQAEKLESGEITKEEYDQWRYTYPKMEAEQTRQELDADKVQ